MAATLAIRSPTRPLIFHRPAPPDRLWTTRRTRPRRRPREHRRDPLRGPPNHTHPPPPAEPADRPARGPPPTYVCTALPGPGVPPGPGQATGRRASRTAPRDRQVPAAAVSAGLATRGRGRRQLHRLPDGTVDNTATRRSARPCLQCPSSVTSSTDLRKQWVACGSRARAMRRTCPCRRLIAAIAAIAPKPPPAPGAASSTADRHAPHGLAPQTTRCPFPTGGGRLSAVRSPQAPGRRRITGGAHAGEPAGVSTVSAGPAGGPSRTAAHRLWTGITLSD